MPWSPCCLCSSFENTTLPYDRSNSSQLSPHAQFWPAQTHKFTLEIQLLCPHLYPLRAVLEGLVVDGPGEEASERACGDDARRYTGFLGCCRHDRKQEGCEIEMPEGVGPECEIVVVRRCLFDRWGHYSSDSRRRKVTERLVWQMRVTTYPLLNSTWSCFSLLKFKMRVHTLV